MPNEPTAPKRTRKASTPRATTTTRVRKPKPQAILDIEKEAAAKKAKYRLAQSSGGVLKRIREKMLPRLTPEHRQSLYDELSKTETPALLVPQSPSERLASDPVGGQAQ